MAIRVDGWKMDIGVKHNGDCFDEKSCPGVPYIVHLLMDPMERVTPAGLHATARPAEFKRKWAR